MSRVKRPACRRLQPMRHGLDRRRIFGRFRRRFEALGQRRMMRLTAHGDQRLDPRLRASRDIRRAEIARVRQQALGLAQLIGKSPDLVQHRFELLLVVGRLAHRARHHQQASRRNRGLSVVALVEAAAGHRHNARVFIGQVDLVIGTRPLDRRLGRPAAGLFPARLGLRLPRRELGFVLRLFARMAFLGPRLDLLARLGQLPQTLLAPRQFVRDRHAVGNVRRVGRVGFGHQIGDLGLQLRLDLAGVLMRQRAVPAGVGVDLRAVQRHRPHLQNAHLPRQQQHLNKQSFDLLKKASPECRDRVVVGMIVGRDEPERHRVVSRTLQLAARKHARRVAVNQNAQQNARMIRRRPGTAITAAHRAKRARRQPPRQTAPDVSPEAIRQPREAAKTPSRDRSCENCSSKNARRPCANQCLILA